MPIPPGEPAATLARWEALWRAVGAWDGPDLDEDVWGEVQALYARLVRYGVPILPECAALMTYWQSIDLTEWERPEDCDGSPDNVAACPELGRGGW